MRKTRITRVLLAVLAACFLAALGMAQDVTGRIVGTVTDAQGAVVPKAKVTVTNTQTGQSRITASDATGVYQAIALQIGSYTVAAEHEGFRKSLSAPQTLLINQTLRVDVKLEVGEISETVEVAATASSIETASSTLGSSVTGNQIETAPLNGRNALDLALYVPGVIPTGSTTGGSGAGAGSFSVAGGRQDSVTYLLDGGVNNNLLSNGVVYNPNPDTLAEFKVLTSNYSAEFGRNGGGVVSMVTKSGTNTVHGSAYDYVRNNAFNANSFFNNANGLPVSVLKRNQFGGTIGAPVTIPKIINGKDRFFFFFGYQGQRQSALQTTSETTVYTPAELQGNFSKSNNGTPDPDVAAFLLQNPFYQPNPALASQAIIDPAKFGSVATNYIKAGLVPTSATGSLISQGSATANNDEYTGKIDLLITASDRLSVTLGYHKSITLNPFAYANVSGFPDQTTGSQSFGNIGYTKTFSPTLLNEFRFTAQRNNNFQYAPAAKLPTASQLGIGITPDNPTGPPSIDLLGSGLSLGFSPNGPTALIDNTYTWSDTLTWTKGRHTIKGGFWFTPYQNNTVYDFYVNGDFYFYGAGGSSYLNNDKAAFLLALPDEFLQFGQAPSNIRTHNIGFFAQDEWRVTKRLTLNYGARYEYSSPKVDTQGRSFSLARGQQSTRFPNAPLGLLFPGDAGAPAGSNFPIKNNWAPRLGFAYDPTGTGKTSIRGGIGMFYDILKGEDNLQFNGQAPFFGYADLFFNPLDSNPTAEVNNMTQPYVAAGQPNPFPSKPPAKNINFGDSGFLPFGGGGVYFVNPHIKTPYVFQYNLSIQREVMKNMTAEASYIGSSSHELTGLVDSNPFILGTTTRLFNAPPGVPGNFSYLETFDNVGKAHYNSLALSLTRRTSEIKGLGSLMYQVSYTYGKSIDNTSGFRARNSNVPYYNHNQFLAASDYDLTHYVSINAAWELPFGQWWSSGPTRLTRGWTLYPVMSYRSGLPLDVFAGLNSSGSKPGPSAAGDQNLVRANLVAPVSYYDPHTDQTLDGNPGNYYFNPAAFSYKEIVALGSAPVTNPALRTYGSLGRNAFRGPTRTNVNLTIAKITPIWGERVKSELRADFFNVLNHTQFDNPNLTITSPLFGQISSTGDPRIIQLAFRLTF